MKLKKQLKKLTSKKAKEGYKKAGKITLKNLNKAKTYLERTNDALDKTLGLGEMNQNRRYNIPKGYKLVKKKRYYSF